MPTPKMTISTEGLAFIEGFEELVLWAYDDQDPQHRPIQSGDHIVGVLTIGYGHIGRDVYPGQICTKEEALDWLMDDLAPVEDGVNQYVSRALNQNQFDALCSFAYNLGVGALRRSTLRRLVNGGDFQGAADQFPLWDHDDGRVMEGLLRRREAERALFLKPMEVS